jgi:hypothetical protein
MDLFHGNKKNAYDKNVKCILTKLLLKLKQINLFYSNKISVFKR